MISFAQICERNASVAVVGLGYVGLPLAVALSKHMNVIGFDIDAQRVNELQKGFDRTHEVETRTLQKTTINYTTQAEILREASVIIVAVPTPIDVHRSPDLKPLLDATRVVGTCMPKGCVVVYESTVYPGLTEELCVPLLEKASGFTYNSDFYVGYSPERINTGDKVHTLETVIKIVAASTQKTLQLLKSLYGLVVKAGIYEASSIKVAEAAKVIENTQRDVNIALMNEFSIVCGRMDLDTTEVLEAARTKWNFLPFYPGLVGGHCVGVAPYYLTFKAEALGYYPEVILSGRRINDGMGKYVAETTIKKLIKRKHAVCGARVGILGLTFKENIPDLRNTGVIDIVAELTEYTCEVFVHDPLARPDEALKEYGLNLVKLQDLKNLDALIVAVGHDAYKALRPRDVAAFFGKPQEGGLVDGLVVDIRALFDRDVLQGMGLEVWRL